MDSFRDPAGSTLGSEVPQGRLLVRRLCAVALSVLLTVGLLAGSPGSPNVAQAAATSTPKAAPGYPIRGQSFSITGRLATRVARPVALQRKVGSKWKQVAAGKTNSKGGYSFTTSTSASSAQLRVVAKKVKIGKKTYKRITTKVRKLRTVSVTPAAPMAGETFTVAESLGKKGIRTVRLQRKSGSRWLTIKSAKTNSAGSFKVSASISGSASLRVVAPKTKIKKKKYSAITMKSFRVTTSPQRGTASLPATAVTGQALVATVRFTPARAGRTVQLQQLVGSQWQTVATGAQSSTGAAVLGTAPSAVGTFSYRGITTAYRGAAATTTATSQVTVTSGVTQPSIVIGSLAPAVTGESYSTELVATGGTAPFTWTATGLPDGVTLSSSGLLSGTTTTRGTYDVHFKITDANGLTAETDTTIVVKPVVGIDFDTLPTAVSGDDYDTSLIGTGGTEPYTWSAEDLPTGFSLTTDGHLSGVTTEVGEHQVKLTITDANSKTAEKTVSLTVIEAVAITTTSLPAGEVGNAYSTTLTASGGVAPYSWSATGLPDGLELSTGGALTGTPTTSGTFDAVQITVTDDNGDSASRSFTIEIAAVLSITTTTLPAGVVGTTYPETTLVAAAGTAPYLWSATGLPDGLELSTTGILTGTPTANGTFDAVQITVTDAGSKSAQTTFSIAITQAVHITTASLPNGVVGTDYPETTLTALDGTSPYTWSATGLPDGLNLSTTGILTGTPTVAGAFEVVQITATDNNSKTAEATYTIEITPAVHITTTTLPAGVVGTDYPETDLAAADGTAPYTWTATGLPDGLELSTGGVLSGTPTSVGVYEDVTITVTDAADKTAQATYTITIAQAVHIITASLPGGVIGTDYPETTLAAADGTAPYTWTATGLPVGLELSNAGILTGTPTVDGVFNAVVVTATDAGGKTAEATFTITIAQAVHITTTNLPAGVVGTDYPETTLAAADGNSATYTWGSTTLPAGLTLTEAGVLSGTPTADGTTSVTFTVTDAAGKTATAELAITIAQAVHITTTNLPAGVVGTEYTETTLAAADGNSATYTWTSTTLPNGLALSSAGVLAGTPTADGTTDVTVTVTDAAGKTAEATFSLVIAKAVHITTTNLPAGVVGTEYPETTLVAADGTSPYTWTSTGLPDGLELSTGGVLTGTPTASGTFDAVTITVTDTNDKTAETTYTIVITPAVHITTASLPDGVVNETYPATTVTAADGTGPYTWSATGLPAGLALDAETGILSGTATAADNYEAAQITATDSMGKTATVTYEITIHPVIAVTTTDLLDGVRTEAYSATLAGLGGIAPYQWAISGLPSGLELNAATGEITGTPSEAGEFDLVITLTDTQDRQATKNVQLTIHAVVGITTVSLPAAVVGTDYTAQLAASGGTPGYSWSAATLPDGLSLDADTGAITGNPTATGTTWVAFTVTDGHGKTDILDLSITINPAVHITTTTLPAGVVDTTYPETTLEAADGNGSYTWSSTTLPAGLTLTTAGVLTGTPTTDATTDITVTVTDAAGKTAQANFTIVIAKAVHITTTSLPSVEAGDPYPETTLAAADGTPGYTWTSTALPEGLTLSEAGVLSGTPTTAGDTSVTFTATDANIKTATADLTITITPAVHLTNTALSIGVVGGDYTSTLTAAGGTAPYTITAGTLPDGLTLTDGVISGTPTATARNTPVEITVTDARGKSSTTSPGLTVVKAVSLSAASTNTCAVTPAGGVECWGSNASGQLGDGTTDSSNYPVTVTGLKAQAISVAAGFTHTCALLSTGTVQCWGANDSGQLGVGDTLTHNTVVDVSGIDSAVKIAAGLNFTCATLRDGTVSCWGTGTYGQIGNGSSTSVSEPTAANDLTNVVDVVAGGSHVCALTVSGTVSCWGRNQVRQIGAGGSASQTSYNTPVAVPDVSDVVSLNAQMGAHTCAATSTGAVKCWGNNSVYQLGATSPTASGDALTVADVTDAVEVYAGGGHSCAINAAGALRCWGYNSAGQLGGGTVGTNSAAAVNVPLVDPVSSAAAGSSHTCARTTTGTINCWGSNTAGQLGDGTTTSTVTPTPVVGFNVAAVTVTSVSLDAGVVGTAYADHQLAATGGVAPYTWTATGLPAGLSVSSAGILSGTPTVADTSEVAFTVTDVRGKTDTLTASITVIPAVHVTTASLPSVEAGDAYPETTLAAADGTPGYTWTATGLPDGLTLGTDGVLSGTPTTAGTNTVTVTVTDATSKTATAELELVITAAAHLTSTSLSIGVIGGDYTSALTVAGGTAPYTITASSLPAGLSLTDGTISGTPTTAATNTPVELTVTDAHGKTATSTLNLTVAEPKTAAGGYYHSCAITPTGGVECWGTNGSGQLGDGTTTSTYYPVATVDLGGRVISLTAGYNHTCALLANGKVQCWGNNTNGQLGTGNQTLSSTPQDVLDIDDAVSLAAGQYFTCATLRDGTASCWGTGNFGQIGNGTSSSVSEPKPVTGLTNLVDVETGSAHACALTTSGSVSCWGRNAQYQLGAGSTPGASSNVPVAIPDVSGAISLSAHLGAHTCVATNTGTVKCWGNNTASQLGAATPSLSIDALSVAEVTDAAAVVVGGTHSCAISTSGAMRCWGSNTSGQLGDATSDSLSASPVLVNLTGTAASASAGTTHTCALLTDGALNCWGGNVGAQLGNGYASVQYFPLTIPAISNAFTTVSMGTDSACGLTAGGAVECWGSNTYGQLGDGTTTASVDPVQVSGLTAGVTAISVGEQRACALTSAGGVKCWGHNAYGEIGDGTTTDAKTPATPIGLSEGVVSVATGATSSCAVMSNGTVKCWGQDGAGQLGDKSTSAYRSSPVQVWGLSDAASVGVGWGHACAVTTTGALQCWGSNNNGALGNSSTTLNFDYPVAVTGLSSGVTAVTAGMNSTCAVVNGGLQCWGANSSGQLGNGTTTDALQPTAVTGLSSGVASVDASTNHACALTTSGSMKCWGSNSSGQLGDGTNTAKDSPAEVPGLSSGVSSITAGGSSSCALLDDGSARCWGNNSSGQLGIRTVYDPTPTPPVGFNVAPLTAGSVSLNSGVAGTAYPSRELSANGGVAPYTWTATGLPAGLSLSTAGILSGTPTEAGTADVTFTVTDVRGKTDSVTASITITPAVHVTTTELPSGVVGTAYAATLTAADGTGPYTWTASGLPTTLTLSSGGQISGTPDSVGILDEITITVTDANGKTDSFAASITIIPAVNITTTSLPVGVVGTSYQATLEAADGTSPHAWSSSTLPAGLELATDGTLTGTPTTAGTTWVAFTVTDKNGKIDILDLQIAITPAVHITTTTLPTNVVVGEAYPETTLTAADGAPGYTWTATGLPSGLTLNSATGVLSGTPTASGAYSVEVTATDQNDKTATTTIPLSVFAVAGAASDLTSIDGGGLFTCAVNNVGGVECWGYNTQGQLGNGTTTNSLSPVAVTGLTSGVAAVTASNSFACALTNAGGVKCWGYNTQGQLGNGTTTNSTTPVDVDGLTSGVTAITAGTNFACALTSAGAVKCWGYNVYGQLGNTTNTSSSTPTTVDGLTSGVTAISAGLRHACAVTAGGGAKCWGYNYYGQLGNGTTIDTNAPVDVDGLTSGATAVTTGNNHSCALTTDGGIKCWGYNSSGQLGNSTTTDSATPVDVDGLTSGATSVTAGGAHTCAITSGGGARCWGYNSGGQLGNESTTTSSTAVEVTGLTSGVTAISAGGSHTCAITGSHDVACWGTNTYGQLGNGQSSVASTPLAVTGLASGIAATVAGNTHSCALTSTGGVECWGGNSFGQLGNGTTTASSTAVEVTGLTSGVTALAVGGSHTCALTAAGGVKCWGFNSNGQLGNSTAGTDVPTPVDVEGLSSGVTAIAAGGSHTCALTTSGGIKCWGNNFAGAVGDATTNDRYVPVDVNGLTSGVSAITAGGSHTCALTTGGGVKCWGYNATGELGNGTTTASTTPVDVNGLTSGATALDAGGSDSCALTTGGGVKCWGSNNNGQLGNGTTVDANAPVDVSGLASGAATVNVGGYHACAVTTAGALKCWGQNSYGQLGNGATTNATTPVDVTGLSSEVANVAAGNQHTCAVTTAGGVTCWGNNVAGQLGNSAIITLIPGAVVGHTFTPTA